MASTASRVFKNIASNWLGLLINIVVSFFLAPFVVNHLGADMYGIWAVVMQFTGYVYLMDFGVRDSIIRYTAKYRATQNVLALRRILSVALILYSIVFLFGMLFTSVISFVLLGFINISSVHMADAQIALFLMGANISVSFLFNIYGGLLQGLQRFDVSNVIGVIFGLLRAATVVVVLNGGGKVVELAGIQVWFTLLGGIITVIAAQILMRREGLSIRPIHMTARKFRVLLRLVSGHSTYVFINNIGQKLTFATDALIISVFLPIASVTYYAIAGNLISYLITLVASTAQVFNPVASHYAVQNDKAGLRTLMLRSARLNLFIGLPIVGTYILLGDIFVRLWMGEEFVEKAYEVLMVLGFAQILSFPHHTIASILYGIGQHRTLAFLRMAEGLINLALSILLVKSIGLIGVAIGTAIPHTIIFGIILPVYACRLLGIPWWQYVQKSLVGPLLNLIPFSFAALAVREYLVPSNLMVFFLLVGGLSLLYLITGYRLCLLQEERNIVRAYVSRFIPTGSSQ